MQRIPDDKLAEWQSDLIEQLPWQTSASESAAELESASFMAMAAKGGG